MLGSLARRPGRTSAVEEPVSRPRVQAGAHVHRRRCFTAIEIRRDVAPQGGLLLGAHYECRAGGPAHLIAELARISSDQQVINPLSRLARRAISARLSRPLYTGDRRTRDQSHRRKELASHRARGGRRSRIHHRLSATSRILAGTSSAPALHSTGAAEFARFPAANGRCAATSRIASTPSRIRRRSTSRRRAGRRSFPRRRQSRSG